MSPKIYSSLSAPRKTAVVNIKYKYSNLAVFVFTYFFKTLNDSIIISSMFKVFEQWQLYNIHPSLRIFESTSLTRTKFKYPRSYYFIIMKSLIRSGSSE